MRYLLNFTYLFVLLFPSFIFAQGAEGENLKAELVSKIEDKCTIVEIQPLIDRIVHSDPRFFSKNPNVKKAVIIWSDEKLKKREDVLRLVTCLSYIGGEECAKTIEDNYPTIQDEFTRLQNEESIEGVSDPILTRGDCEVGCWFRNAGLFEDETDNKLPFLDSLVKYFSPEIRNNLRGNIEAITYNNWAESNSENETNPILDRTKLVEQSFRRFDNDFNINNYLPQCLQTISISEDLFAAIEVQDLKLIRSILMTNNVDPFQTREEVVDEKTTKIVTTLMENASAWDVDSKSDSNTNKKVIEIARLLLNKCSNHKVPEAKKEHCDWINYKNDYDGTAITIYAWSGNEEIVELLLNLGATVNHDSKIYGNTLGAAASSGSEKIFNLILEKVKQEIKKEELIAFYNASIVNISNLVSEEKDNKRKHTLERFLDLLKTQEH